MNTRAKINAAIDELFDNPAEIKAELERLDGENRLVDSLLAARHAAGLSQRALAKASGMSPAKICRMESGNDANLRLGDVQTYLKGLGSSLRLSVQPPRRRRPRVASFRPRRRATPAHG